MCLLEKKDEIPGSCLAEGKTKFIFATPKKDQVSIHLKPVLTAGDGDKRDVVEGVDSCKTTQVCNIYTLLKNKGVRNHFLWKRDPTSFQALRCRMVPLEVVVRRRVPSRSSYLKRNPGVREGTVFKELVVELFFKDDTRHDPFVYIGESGEWYLFDPSKPVTEGGEIERISPLLSEEEVEHIKNQARSAFLILEQAFERVDVILHDFKVEFGRVGERIPDIIIADTITADEMRLTEGEVILCKDVYRAGGDIEVIKEVIKKNYAHVAYLTERFFSSGAGGGDMGDR